MEELRSEKLYAILNMKKYGGSFVKSLADAFAHADTVNFEKLKKTFPEIWDEYRFWDEKDLLFKVGTFCQWQLYSKGKPVRSMQVEVCDVNETEIKFVIEGDKNSIITVKKVQLPKWEFTSSLGVPKTVEITPYPKEKPGQGA